MHSDIFFIEWKVGLCIKYKGSAWFERKCTRFRYLCGVSSDLCDKWDKYYVILISSAQVGIYEINVVQFKSCAAFLKILSHWSIKSLFGILCDTYFMWDIKVDVFLFVYVVDIIVGHYFYNNKWIVFGA